MVKIVKAPAGPEIITFRDLAGIKAAGPAGPLQTASSAVENLDKWISLADRGISMLGRVDSILGRVGTLKGGQQQQQQAPPPQRLLDAPPGMSINKDQQQQAPGDPAPPLPGPVILPRVPPVQEIIRALDMIAKMTPGLTVQQLSDTMKQRPDEVQHILTVALSGELPK